MRTSLLEFSVPLAFPLALLTDKLIEMCFLTTLFLLVGRNLGSGELE